MDTVNFYSTGCLCPSLLGGCGGADTKFPAGVISKRSSWNAAPKFKLVCSGNCELTWGPTGDVMQSLRCGCQM